MSGDLTHSPADIIAQHIVDLSLGTFTSGSNWQVCVAHEPNSPDKVITVFNSGGSTQGSLQPSGQVVEFYGVQVRARDARYSTGWDKLQTIATTLDTVKKATVTISGTSYTLTAVNRTGNVLHLGKEAPTSKRDIFVFNAQASIKQN